MFPDKLPASRDGGDTERILYMGKTIQCEIACLRSIAQIQWSTKSPK
jgi:hypothetical protein